MPYMVSANAHFLRISFQRLKNSLKKLNEAYDVILIDCGPNLGILTINAILFPVFKSFNTLISVEIGSFQGFKPKIPSKIQKYE